MSIDECKYLAGMDVFGIKTKRLSTIVSIWDHLITNKTVDNDRFKLSTPLINEIVEHYINDLRAIKCRSRITGKIQLHKVAGLMAALIIRYRPIILIDDKYVNDKEMYINELFAITYGLAICGEHSLEQCEKLSNSEWFTPWINDFMYLLHSRNHTPESLIFIFQTFSVFNFPENFSVE